MLVPMLQYNWFKTLIPGMFQMSVTATIAPDRFKQGRKTLLKVIAIGEREIRTLSELSSAETKNRRIFKVRGQGSHRPSALANWSYPKRK